MTEAPTVAAWIHHEEPVHEKQFTPDADTGWLAWNGQSPEVEVVLFVASLVMMMRPRLVIETGVGQGYMTRAIVEMLNEDDLLVAYESDDNWRAAIWPLEFWIDHRFTARLSAYTTPDAGLLAEADLCVLDSDFVYRFLEIEAWNEYAKPGAVALIHDTAERDGTIHQSARDLIANLGMTGVFLNNPRGCFMAVQRKET